MGLTERARKGRLRVMVMAPMQVIQKLTLTA